MELHRHIAVDSRQLLTHQNPLAIILQAFPISPLSHFFRTFQQSVERPELLNQILRALVPDPRRARNIVDRIALQSQQVRHLPGRNPHEFFHFGGVVPGVVLGRVQHGDLVGHQLQHVLVARNDHDLETRLRRLSAQRADHVVRLIARRLHNRNPQAFNQLLYVRNLLDQVRRSLGTVGLVVGVLFLAKRLAQAFKHRHHVFGFECFRELPQHVAENEHCLRGQPPP